LSKEGGGKFNFGHSNILRREGRGGLPEGDISGIKELLFTEKKRQ